MANETQAETGQTAPGEANMKPGDEAPPGTPGTGDNVCPECSGKGSYRAAASARTAPAPGW
jgi:hypothetical protein